MKKTYVILASGQSLTPQQIGRTQLARSKGLIQGVIGVSNVALDLLDYADAIVSHDAAWWKAHPKALKLPMRKFCRNLWPGTEHFIPFITQACNSGLMAMDVACKIFGAERLILLGFDMHGTHYFGPHTGGLKNTNDARFKMHLRQFESWNGCEVINCTPNSALKKFPVADLYDIIK